MKFLVTFITVLFLVGCTTFTHEKHAATGYSLPFRLNNLHMVYPLGSYQEQTKSSHIRYEFGSYVMTIYFADPDISVDEYFDLSKKVMLMTKKPSNVILDADSDRNILGENVEGKVIRIYEPNESKNKGPVAVDSIGVWTLGDKLIKVRISEKSFVVGYTDKLLTSIYDMENLVLTEIKKAQAQSN